MQKNVAHSPIQDCEDIEFPDQPASVNYSLTYATKLPGTILELPAQV